MPSATPTPTDKSTAATGTSSVSATNDSRCATDTHDGPHTSPSNWRSNIGSLADTVKTWAWPIALGGIVGIGVSKECSTGPLSQMSMWSNTWAPTGHNLGGMVVGSATGIALASYLGSVFARASARGSVHDQRDAKTGAHQRSMAPGKSKADSFRDLRQRASRMTGEEKIEILRNFADYLDLSDDEEESSPAQNSADSQVKGGATHA